MMGSGNRTRRLTAADSWFLYLEGPTMGLHVVGLMLLDPASAPERFDYERFEALLTARLDQLEALGQRVVEVPMGIDHPLVVPHEVDLSQHLSRVELAGRPGSEKSQRALRRTIDEFCSTPLDRSRPLWEMLFVEGLADGRFALLAKLHHAMVDGVSGVGFMADLLDLEPDAPLERPSPEPLEDHGTGDYEHGEPADRTDPPVTEVMWDAVLNRVSDPLRPMRAVTRTGGSLLNAAGALLSGRDGGQDRAAPFSAPHTRLNGSLTPRRAVAFDSVPLARVKAIHRAHGVTLNDVLLAACASALREHLRHDDDLPDRPLVAAVPVSVHGQATGDGDADASTNQVSNMFVNLPVNIADPIERLMAVHRSAMSAKAIQATLGAEMLGDLIDLVPPPMLSAATNAFVRSRLSEWLPPTHSVIVSNVPGPDFPLYLGGAEIVGLYPFGPLMEGSGLNITVLSHDGRLDIGLIACPDLVPELDQLMAGVLVGFDELEDLTPQR